MTWTLFSHQEQSLNAFHMRNLRRFLGITWQDWVTNESILSQIGMPSMFAILTQRHLRWLGHVCRMEDGRIPKDILYGKLASGTQQSGWPTLRYKDTCKRDLKACGINPAQLEEVTSDRTSWRSRVKEGVMSTKERREIQLEEKILKR